LKKVLVAEDDEIGKKLILALLQHHGYEGIMTSTGKECLDELAKGLRPDLLLLDLGLPEMNGLEVLAALGKYGHTEAFPIIVFSGNKDKEVVKKAIELGAYDYIIKPYNVMGLGKRITDLMFNINEADLKAILSNLRINDPALFRNQGLQGWAHRGYLAYPARYMGHNIALLMPEGIGPQAKMKETFAELTSSILIFRKGEHGWRKVWPTYSALTSKVPA